MGGSVSAEIKANKTADGVMIVKRQREEVIE